MFRQIFWVAMSCAALLAGAGAARAEPPRLALVMGMSAYRAVTPLPNPANDAKAMAQMLSDAGFEVTTAADLSQKDMNEQVANFAAKIAAKGPDTVALVFYAGHGLQIDGENYLVPVDVDPKRETDIPLQAVRLNDVLNTLNSVPSRMRILLLDACRNNPFPAISQTTGHGLALVDTKTGAPGTFLSYSTSPGAEAEDGAGLDSPYTTAVLAAAREPGLPIEEAFKRVRVAVNRVTEGRQTPWESSSLTEDFRFIQGGGASAANAGPTPPLAKRTVADWRHQLQGKPVEVANEMIVADGTLEAYEAFVALFTQPPFGPQARLWLDRQRRMVAWSHAVTVNTAAAYRTFLGEYSDSDLAPTARKLIERLRYRPDFAPAVATVAGGAPLPIPVSTGLTCPCTQPVLPLTKKVDAPAKYNRDDTKRVDTKRDADPPRRVYEPDPPRRVYLEPPPRIRKVEEPVVVYGRPPMREDYHERSPSIGLSFGFGGFGGGGGMRGGQPMGTMQGRPHGE